MAVTNMDNVVAGYQQPIFPFKVGITMEAAGVFYTPLYQTGYPGNAVANGLGLAGAALTSYAGQIPYTDPVSGNSHLCRHSVCATQPGAAFLIDRLWHNDTIAEATTTAQTINSVAWPARDVNGSTNGEGVQVAIEVSAATSGAAVTNTTMSYTNSAGVAGRTATMASFPASATQGTFVPFQLQAGDTGVRSIQSLTLGTTYGTGTIHLVAYRVLDGPVPINVANQSNQTDFVGTGMVRCYNGSVPQSLWLPQATTAATFWFGYQWLHG